MPAPILVSHTLCPYVQRAAIAFAEKATVVERRYVDLSNKPDWFREMSPLGKVPLLCVKSRVLFESSAICEYVEETTPGRLHPNNPLDRAEHRSWIEFASATLNDIAGLYNAPDRTTFEAKANLLGTRFDRLEARIGEGPFFAGEPFSLVDAAFAPVFRYFDTFESACSLFLLEGRPKVMQWRHHLSVRASVRRAVGIEYQTELTAFLSARNSYISGLVGIQPLTPTSQRSSR